MKAILISEAGSADQLFMGQAPDPQIHSHEILVKNHATSINRADILQREGKYPPPHGASPILGLDIAGEVVEIGNQVSRWKKGDRVMALVSGGGYAQLSAIHEEMAIPIPNHLSYEEAAAIPEVFLTAYQTLFTLGHISRISSILVHAGASGVGTAGIQLAHAVTQGHHPLIVTVGSEDKKNKCLSLGATHAIEYKQENFAEQVLSITNNQGVDLILDFIGAPYWEKNLQCIATDGTLVLVAAMGGIKSDKLNLLPILQKRIHIQGTTLRARTDDYKIKLTKDFSDFSLPLFQNHTLKPIVDRIFSWDDVVSAHRYMESNQNTGKIVLTIQ